MVALQVAKLIMAFQQAPGDDLRLNFARTLENIQDAGIAQNAGDGEFQ